MQSSAKEEILRYASTQLREIADALRVPEIADALRVPRRGSRFAAVDRGSRDFNCALDPVKGCYVDFVSGDHGGIVRFVERFGGMDRDAAWHWLSDFAGVPLRAFSAEERQEWARRRHQAEREAAALTEWRDAKIRAITARRNASFDTYHEKLRRILQHSLDHPNACVWADECEASEREYQAFDHELDSLRKPNWPELVARFRAEAA